MPLSWMQLLCLDCSVNCSKYKRKGHSFNILPTSAIFLFEYTAYPFVSFSFKILPTCVIFFLSEYCLPQRLFSLLKYWLPVRFFWRRGCHFDSYAHIVDSTNARRKQPCGRRWKPLKLCPCKRLESDGGRKVCLSSWGENVGWLSAVVSEGPAVTRRYIRLEDSGSSGDLPFGLDRCECAC